MKLAIVALAIMIRIHGFACPIIPPQDTCQGEMVQNARVAMQDQRPSAMQGEMVQDAYTTIPDQRPFAVQCFFSMPNCETHE